MSDAALAALLQEASDAASTPAGTKALKPGEPAGFDPVSGRFIDKDGKIIPPKKSRQGRSVSQADFELDTRSVFDKQPDMLVTRDADGYRTDLAGKKRLPVAPRQTYRRGQFFRVVGENVRVEAVLFYGAGTDGRPITSGLSWLIPVGTIVECIGWRQFRKGGLVAPQFIYPGLPREAKWSWIWPLDGLLRPWPMQGILEPATAEEYAGQGELELVG